jgi:hypothetical protein
LHDRLSVRADIALVSDRDDFLLKPNTIDIPFGGKKSRCLSARSSYRRSNRRTQPPSELARGVDAGLADAFHP